MPTIYGVYKSRATRPLWLMMESGQPFDHIPVIQAYRLPDPHAADAPLHTASPEFLKVNPQSQVPCMKDGDLVLTESMAITLYLAKKYGGGLGPQNLEEDAQMTNWAFVGATSVELPALDILFTIVKGEDKTEAGQARIDAAKSALTRPFARLDAHLARHDYLVADRFTAADICMAECVRYAQISKDAMAPYPAISAWLERVQARAAFKTMMENRNAEPA